MPTETKHGEGRQCSTGRMVTPEGTLADPIRGAERYCAHCERWVFVGSDKALAGWHARHEPAHARPGSS